MSFRLIIVAVLIGSFFVPGTLAGADIQSHVIENLHTNLLAVMKKADSLGYAGRYNRLAPVITSTFDLPYIARIVVGRHWHNFSNDEKRIFLDTFSRLSIATYANRFNSYSGEQFKTISTKELRKGRTIVRSLLIKTDGDEIKLDYILHKKDNDWLVINVIAKGVSDLALKRADYTAFLKKSDLNALLDKLNEKIALYSKE
ncbi:MAG: ABC transporter substrate-binding protein [Thermodesulfobacteriota bacterium]|nr:ABC transporter substrate-binding protein [Thermodesulfobacteriota bacterium]